MTFAAFRDALAFGLGALREHKLRSFLSMLGIAIGVAAVILLTSIGERTRARWAKAARPEHPQPALEGQTS